jgi:acetylornithine deacetylase
LDVTSRTTLARDPLETHEAADIVTSLQAATRLVSGQTAPIAPMSYWADSAFIAAAGIPTVLYGPDGDGAHADIEWVSLAGTETCAQVLTETAVEFCR